MENKVEVNQMNDQNVERIIKRNLFLYVIGTTTSKFGSEIYMFAMSLFILKTTGSGIAFSIALITKYLPGAILSPIAGAIADKFSRKKLIIGMDVLAGIVMMLHMTYTLCIENNCIAVYIAIFVLSCISTMFGITVKAAKPNLVNRDNLTKINSYGHMVNSIAQICSPLLTGFVYLNINLSIFMLINGLSFFVSALTECFFVFKFNQQSKQTIINRSFPPLKDTFVKGFQYLIKSKLISVLTLAGVVMDFIMISGVAVSLPVIINSQLGLSPSAYSVINISYPIGMLAASLIMSQFMNNSKRYYMKIIGGMTVVSLGVILIGVISSPILSLNNLIYIMVFCIYGFSSSFAIVIMDVPIRVIFQETIPNEVLGTVMGVVDSISLILTPIGMILSGILIDVFPAFILPLASGVILLIFTYILSRIKTIKIS